MTTWIYFQCHRCRLVMDDRPEACPQCGSVDIHTLMALSRPGLPDHISIRREREANERIAAGMIICYDFKDLNLLAAADLCGIEVFGYDFLDPGYEFMRLYHMPDLGSHDQAYTTLQFWMYSFAAQGLIL